MRASISFAESSPGGVLASWQVPEPARRSAPALIRSGRRSDLLFPLPSPPPTLSAPRKTRWILTRSATPSIGLLHRQIHRQKSVPVSNPQLPPDFEGKQSAWQEGISSRFNEVGRCTSRQNSGKVMGANCPRTVLLPLLWFEQLNQTGGKNRMSHCSKFDPCLSGCYPHPRHVGCCQAPE